MKRVGMRNAILVTHHASRETALVHVGGNNPTDVHVMLNKVKHLFLHLKLRSFPFAVLRVRMTNPRSTSAKLY